MYFNIRMTEKKEKRSYDLDTKDDQNDHFDFFNLSVIRYSYWFQFQWGFEFKYEASISLYIETLYSVSNISTFEIQKIEILISIDELQNIKKIKIL